MGGRSSGGGKSVSANTSEAGGKDSLFEALRNNESALEEYGNGDEEILRSTLQNMTEDARERVADEYGVEVTVSSNEKNQRELARVTRESRTSGYKELTKGTVYVVQWGKGTRQGTYVRGEMKNGVAVRIFKDTKTGKLFALDNDDVKSSVKSSKKK